MPGFNLVRNSRAFFTHDVTAATGVVSAALTAAKTFEISILDGFSFSQSTNSDTVTVSEAGSDPIRGQRSFNTSLNAVEFSFSTYIRPRIATTVKTDDGVLWNALQCATPIGSGTALTVGAASLTGATYTSTSGILTVTGTSITDGQLIPGTVYHMSGFTGTSASIWNTPVIYLGTVSGTAFNLQYLSAPPGSAALPTVTTGIRFNTTALVEHAQVANDVVVGTNPYTQITSALSNKNQLAKFGMIFIVDGVTYVIDDCAMESVTIDFGLDGIATAAWSGKGRILRNVAPSTSWTSGTITQGSGFFSGTYTPPYNATNTTNNYITNKLSTVSLKKNIGGGGTQYTLALTGGSITIANNIEYVVPATLGIVNQSVGYYTGTRSITGTINAYLKTGSSNTNALLSDILSNINSGSAEAVEPKYQLEIAVGGKTNTTRVELLMDGCNLQVPTVDAQAVMSTSINFTAQGTSYVMGASATYDLENTNDLRVRYFSATA